MHRKVQGIGSHHHHSQGSNLDDADLSEVGGPTRSAGEHRKEMQHAPRSEVCLGSQNGSHNDEHRGPLRKHGESEGARGALVHGGQCRDVAVNREDTCYDARFLHEGHQIGRSNNHTAYRSREE